MSIYLGIIGSGDCDSSTAQLAFEVGKEAARKGAVIVCGGLEGVMKAVCRGSSEVGGISLGILPGHNKMEANPYVSYVFTTGLGELRNFLVVRCSDVLIAVAGEYGTLSEMAIALKEGKHVIALQPRYQLEGVIVAADPKNAVELALQKVIG